MTLRVIKKKKSQFSQMLDEVLALSVLARKIGSGAKAWAVDTGVWAYLLQSNSVMTN